MAVNLTKGQDFELTKGNPELTNIVVGLGCQMNAVHGI